MKRGRRLDGYGDGSTRVLERQGRWCGVGVLGVLLLSCAPTQVVPIRMDPAPMTVFVDGRRVPEEDSRQVELKADRAHVFLFKKEGYQSEQVVLRSQPGPERPRLEPDEIVVQLIPLEGRKPGIAVSLDPIEEHEAE